MMATGKGTPDNPWVLNTPLGSAQFEMHRDEDKQVLHCQVGSTWLHYQLRALDDLHAMLAKHGDWMELGNKDERDEPKPGTVEHWGRSATNPVYEDVAAWLAIVARKIGRSVKKG